MRRKAQAGWSRDKKIVWEWSRTGGIRREDKERGKKDKKKRKIMF